MILDVIDQNKRFIFKEIEISDLSWFRNTFEQFYSINQIDITLF